MSAGDVKRVRIGVSSCLLGECVRFDGGHQRDRFLTDIFGRYVDWVPVCPEFEMGLGVPRESLRLVNKDGTVRLIANASGSDHTERMQSWAALRLGQLADEGLCGYVFKQKSPSCGVYRTKGMFAALFVERFPHLPFEEEGRLNDPRLRENFISSVFSYKRWMDLRNNGLSRSAIMQFHARHKFLLMAHNQTGARALGTILGQAGRASSLKHVAEEYFDAFSEVMRRIPTRRNHTNVLQHLAGYVTEDLEAADRAELTATIDSYRRELLPLIVPITLIRHYVRKFEVKYLQDQVYLDPHPHELMLLNHV